MERRPPPRLGSGARSARLRDAALRESAEITAALQDPSLEFRLARDALLDSGAPIALAEDADAAPALHIIAPVLPQALADLAERVKPRMAAPQAETKRVVPAWMIPTQRELRAAASQARYLERKGLALAREAAGRKDAAAQARAVEFARLGRRVQSLIPAPGVLRSARARARRVRPKAHQEGQRLVRFIGLVEEVLREERRHGRHPDGQKCALASASGRPVYRREDLDALVDMVDVDATRRRTRGDVSRQARRARALAAIRTAIRRALAQGDPPGK